MEQRKSETLFNPNNVTFIEFFPAEEDSQAAIVVHFTGPQTLTQSGEDAIATWDRLNNFMIGGAS